MLEQNSPPYFFELFSSVMKMKYLSNSYLLVLATCLMVTAGCAVTPEKSQASDALQFQDLNNAGNPQESRMLSEIATMQSGEKSAVDGTVFVIGEAYSSASGLNCKSVVINDGSTGMDSVGRVACDDGGAWFFVTNVFEADTEIVETNIINADVSILK